VVRLRANAVVERLAMPAPMHGAGEALKAIYVAPNGTMFIAGYNYTGVDGADTGVIYQREPGGEVRIVYARPENELGSIFGAAADDVWAVGNRVLVHYDGTCWREEPGPDGERYFEAVYAEGTKVWLGTSGRIWSRDGAGAWQEETTTQDMVMAFARVGSDLWAATPSGVYRKSGETWTRFSDAGGWRFWAPTPQDLLLAGRELMRSTRARPFQKVSVGIKIPSLPKLDAQVVAVDGRSLDDFYAGTLSGIAHFQNTAFARTEFIEEVSDMTFAGDDLYILHNAR
jgi:hypothetical protein